jgi:hypothetical protein
MVSGEKNRTRSTDRIRNIGSGPGCCRLVPVPNKTKTMKKAIIIPAEEAEPVRSDLLKRGLLDKTRKIKVSNRHIGEKSLEIPVTGDVEGHTVIEQKELEYYGKWESLKERLDFQPLF